MATKAIQIIQDLSASVTLTNRSRSPILVHDLEFQNTDGWYWYGSNTYCRCGDIVRTFFIINEPLWSWQICQSDQSLNLTFIRCGGDIFMTMFFLNLSLWPWKIGHGHQSLSLTLSFIMWITGINMEVIHIIGVKISWWRTINQKDGQPDSRTAAGRTDSPKT